jgi:hypothetical protein
MRHEIRGNQRPVRLAYQPPATSTFLSEQINHQQSGSSTFLSEQISTSHQPPAKRTGCKASSSTILPKHASQQPSTVYTCNFAALTLLGIWDVTLLSSTLRDGTSLQPCK